MQILLAGVCFANFLVRVALGTCVVGMTQEYQWDLESKGMLLGAFFWGYLFGNFSFGLVLGPVGAGKLLAYGAMAWSLLSMSIPLAADIGFVSAWMSVFLFGLATSPCIAASSSLLSAEVPPCERGRAIAGRALGLRAGQFVSTFLAPLICTTSGWRQVFFTFGSVSLAFGVSWTYFLSSNSYGSTEGVPLRPFPIDNEFKDQTQEEPMPFPFHIFWNKGFLALLMVHSSNSFTMYTLVSWGPTYFNEVLQVPLEGVGLYLSVPILCVAIGQCIGGQAMDCMLQRKVPLLVLRRRTLCPAMVGASLTVTYFGWLSHATTACISLGMAMIFIGIADSAQGAVYLDIAPNTAGVVVGMGNGIATLPGAVGPLLIASIVQKTGKWSLVWVCVGCFAALSSAIFAFHGTTSSIELEDCSKVKGKVKKELLETQA